jgi:propionate CoA-transferase
VRINGVLVDDLVLVPEQRQCAVCEYDPAISVEAPMPVEHPMLEMPEGIRRIIAQRAAREVTPGLSLNFGFGIPGGIPSILDDRGLLASCWGSVEQGIHNGRMMDGAMFGAARYPQAIVSSVDQFDFFGGGGIDLAFLGMGEMGSTGDVNVSRPGDTLVGPGGFIDITQGARKVVFCGTFEAKGLDVTVRDGTLHIRSPGRIAKLMERVRHVTFSGAEARAHGTAVLYVTERAVFRLAQEGIELIEVADGADVQRDILERMEFQPIVRNVGRIGGVRGKEDAQLRNPSTVRGAVTNARDRRARGSVLFAGAGEVCGTATRRGGPLGVDRPERVAWTATARARARGCRTPWRSRPQQFDAPWWLRQQSASFS